jgi:hypothetical protein
VAQLDPATAFDTSRVDIDENGVDRAQIRQLLALSPEERLRRAEAIAEDILRIWKLNGIRPIR